MTITQLWEEIKSFFTGKGAWRHKISLDAVPEVEKKYNFMYAWAITEPRLTEDDIRRILNLIYTHFEETYNATVIQVSGEVGYQFFFTLHSPTNLTLRQIWKELKDFAILRYMDLDLHAASIYLPYPPHLWAWGLGALTFSGVVIAIAKSGKEEKK